MKKIRVVIADNHIYAAEGLVRLVSDADDMECVGSTTELLELPALIKKESPDILVLDVAWSGDKQAGINILPDIHAIQPSLPVVMVTVYPELIEPARQAGAFPLSKGFSRHELLNAIRWAVRQKESALNLSANHEIFPLTPVERDVLNLLARGLRDDEIARELNRSAGTVKKHVANIFSKLNAKNRTQAAVIAERYNLTANRTRQDKEHTLPITKRSSSIEHSVEPTTRVEQPKQGISHSPAETILVPPSLSELISLDAIEHAVLKLLVNGYAENQIAVTLGSSKPVVNRYAGSIVKKLNVKKLSEAILLAQRFDLIAKWTTEVEKSLKPPSSEDIFSLTPKELAVLKLLIEEQTDKQIALNLSTTESTIKKNTGSITKKLKVKNRTEAVILAKKYRLVDYWSAQMEVFKLVIDNIESIKTLMDIADRFNKIPSPPRFAGINMGEQTNHLNDIANYARAAVESLTSHNRQIQIEQGLNLLRLTRQNLSINSTRKLNQRLNKALAVWEKVFTKEYSRARTVIEIPNVYIVGSPLLAQSSVFKGRGDVFRVLENALTSHADQLPTLLLFGARRMGKTSLLKQLPYVLGPTIIPVIIDLQDLALTNSISNFFASFAANIQSSALLNNRSIILPDISRNGLENDPYYTFSDWMKTTCKEVHNHWILLCIDEYEYFENMISRGIADVRIFQLMRSLMQNFPKLALLFSGGHTVEELKPLWSKYFINVNTIKIGHLSEKDAQELIQRPKSDFPLDYSKIVVKRILASVGGHPYLLQATCRELVDILNNEGKFYANDVSDVDKALSTVLMTASAYFKELWGETKANDSQQKIMVEIAKRKGDVVPKNIVTNIGDHSALQTLLSHDVLEEKDNGYCFKVELVRRWVERQIF